MQQPRMHIPKKSMSR